MGRTNRKETRNPWDNFQAWCWAPYWWDDLKGSEAVIAYGLLRMWGPRPERDTHTSSPWFPCASQHIALEKSSLLSVVHRVCMMTSTNMPGHHLLWVHLSYCNLQHIQQKFFKVYGMWAKLLPNFKSWCRFSSFLVGLVLAFILRCRGSWNITISLCLKGLSSSHPGFVIIFLLVPLPQWTVASCRQQTILIHIWPFRKNVSKHVWD